MTIGEQIRTTLESGEKILIVAHKNPDADAIGSALAMYAALKQWGKEARIAMYGEMAMNFAYLPYFFRIQEDFDPRDFDTVIIMDCGGWARTGFFEDDELNIDWPERLVVIDHHAIQGLTPGLHLILPTSSSTAEVVYELFKEWGVRIDRAIAECLMIGMAFDTGFFRHSNTSQRTLEIVADLMTKGAVLHTILRQILPGMSLNQLHMWGELIGRLRLVGEGTIAATVVQDHELTELGLTRQDLGGLVELINTVTGTKFSLMLSETGEGTIKGSMRTEDDNMNVAAFAKLLTGGGHPKAAGFELPMGIRIDGDKWGVK